MKNNQFAMMSLPFEQQCHELQTIHLLKANESSTLTPNQMWRKESTAAALLNRH